MSMGDFLCKRDVTLHSGGKSDFIVDCANLSDSAMECIAYLLHKKLSHPFGSIEGVPAGGLRIAEYMGKYITPEAKRVLIVDDVLTTGNSMEEQLKGRNRYQDVMGAVIVVRGNLQQNYWNRQWITHLITIEEERI